MPAYKNMNNEGQSMNMNNEGQSMNKNNGAEERSAPVITPEMEHINYALSDISSITKATVTIEDIDRAKSAHERYNIIYESDFVSFWDLTTQEQLGWIAAGEVGYLPEAVFARYGVSSWCETAYDETRVIDQVNENTGWRLLHYIAVPDDKPHHLMDTDGLVIFVNSDGEEGVYLHNHAPWSPDNRFYQLVEVDSWKPVGSVGSKLCTQALNPKA